MSQVIDNQGRAPLPSEQKLVAPKLVWTFYPLPEIKL